MSFAISKSTQFKIGELVLVTKVGRIDISGICEEISIFDSIFLPIVSGNVLITDSLGLSNKLMFDGTEVISMEILKDENTSLPINLKKSFRVYKQTERQIINPGKESYLLHFVSDELIYSDQQKINQSYEMSYTEIVEKILTDYLKVTKPNLGGIYEQSVGLKNIVIPNLRPLEAIAWCAKRAVDKYNSPNFMFFQNINGYNFATLSTLMSNPELIDIKYQTKNVSGNAIDEMSGARYIEVITQNDNIDRTRSGVNAGKFIGFDPITRTIASKNISYGDHYYNMKHGNKTPNFYSVQNRDGSLNTNTFDSRQSLALFSSARQFSEYIKKKDSSSISKEENIESWLFQRKAILKNLMSKQLKIVMPGNFQLTSGFNVNVIAPQLGPTDRKNQEEDTGLSGKYIITATRHIIGFEKHETVIEVASSSSTNEFIAASSQQQQNESLYY